MTSAPVPSRSSDLPMAFAAVADLDRAVAFYVDTLGSSLLEPTADGHARLRLPGARQPLTLIEVRHPGGGRAAGATPDDVVRADIELARAVHATPDDAGLWRTDEGDVVAWYRDHAGAIASLAHRAA